MLPQKHFVIKIIFHYLFRANDAYVNCKIVATPGKYNYINIAFGLQKDSPFLPLFNYYLNVMKEKGIFKPIQVKYEPSPQMCPDYSGKSLGVSSVFTVFIVLIFGFGLSMILFGLEKLTHAFGMKWSIFNSYGIVDPADELYENDTTALLTENDLLKNQILMLKNQILMLKNQVESPKDYAWTD